MIKRIIFDIDNTLLKSEPDCINAYTKYLDDFNLTSQKVNARYIYDILEEFEKSNIEYTKENMSKFISSKIGAFFTKEELDKMISYYSKESTLINSDTKKILEYLSNKYELVALSNWFYETQESRLETRKLKKYFKHVYGVDNLGRKPNIKVYEKACYPHKFNECLMIGDNINFDVKMPYKLGINVIYFNEFNSYTSFDNINNLNKLLEIL